MIVREYLTNINIYQRVLLFAFTMSFIWLVVELISSYSIFYILKNPIVFVNTFAKKQAIWVMVSCMVGTLYLRIINHKIFILPSSFIANVPKHTNILKSSIFSIHNRFKKLLGLAGDTKYPLGLTRLYFSKNCKKTAKTIKN